MIRLFNRAIVVLAVFTVLVAAACNAAPPAPPKLISQATIAQGTKGAAAPTITLTPSVTPTIPTSTPTYTETATPTPTDSDTPLPSADGGNQSHDPLSRSVFDLLM